MTYESVPKNICSLFNIMGHNYLAFPHIYKEFYDLETLKSIQPYFSPKIR